MPNNKDATAWVEMLFIVGFRNLACLCAFYELRMCISIEMLVAKLEIASLFTHVHIFLFSVCL
jgi:uncharacterized membrane protein